MAIYSVDTFLFMLILIIFFLSFSYRSSVLDRKDQAWLQIGLFFTLCADFCMLILYENVLGLIFFIPVQWIYHHRYADRRQAIQLTMLLLVCAAGLFSIHALDIRTETKLAALYALCLCFSVSAAIRAFFQRRYPNPNRALIMVGMLLFFLCDVHVMLYNILPDTIWRTVCQVCIWVYYLPSQLCLCLSGKRFKH